MTHYVELQVLTHFSLLRGASSPGELFAAAALLGYPAIGITAFESVEDVWRRSGVQRAAIEKLADGDAFHGFSVDRRQGLWKVRGLGEAPLPLFAAADRSAETFSAEGVEPEVALRPHPVFPTLARPLPMLREYLKLVGAALGLSALTERPRRALP